jgi:hypothetical protein
VRCSSPIQRRVVEPGVHHWSRSSRRLRFLPVNPSPVPLIFPVDYDSACPYIAFAQSRTCLWVSAGPSYGEEIGKVTGANPSGRFSGQPPDRGHLEATTVRAFLVLFRLSKDRGYSKRHTFIAGSADGVSHPSQGRQSEPKPGWPRFIAARRRIMVPGSPPAGSMRNRPAFV